MARQIRAQGEASARIDALAEEDSSQHDRSNCFVPAEHSPVNSPGRAISPKAPRLRCRTARRSVPTWEVLGKEPGVFRGLGILSNASEVGRFPRKRHVCGAGPLGDRSLSGRFLGQARNPDQRDQPSL